MRRFKFWFIIGFCFFIIILFLKIRFYHPVSAQTSKVKMGNIVPREAMYYRKLDSNRVQCELCFRKCVVEEGQKGFCRNRKNIGGKYYTLVYNLPCALQVDPIEKEPIFHLFPGTEIFCLSTASCNFRCKFCHNWHISQRAPEEISNYWLNPQQIVEMAIKNKCPTISHTYAEPTVHYEYMFDIAKEAKKKGLKFIFHSNGSMSPEPLRQLLKYTDGVCIDLKGFTEEYYSEMSSASLKPVLETLKIIKAEGVWLEIVNLVVPTGNDNQKDIKKMCEWIKDNLGTDVPVHFTRFHPAHLLQNLAPTPVETLDSCRRIAKETGIKYVYIGNVPGHMANSTFCQNCGEILIKRIHFSVLENNIKDGKCKFCKTKIAGIWGK